MREDYSRVRAANSFSERLHANHAISKNRYLTLPVADDGHGEYVQVGRGQVTSPVWCARHTSFFICRDKDVHQGVVHDRVDFSGKDAVSHGHRWCKKPECPRCFLDGWDGDNARAIWGKLSSGVEVGFGVVEHFTVSFPKSDYSLPFDVLRKRAEDGCLRRGIMGAALIPHARRIDRKNKCLKFSFHFHGLGFVRGGYDICRNCSVFLSGRCGVDCGECKGYEARTRREKVNDGLIVKIFAKRASGASMEESVILTARYVLSHASYIPSFRKRFYILSYFGVCANRRLKSCKVPAVHNCPVCASVGVKNVMVRCSHWGDESIVTDIGDPRYVKCFPSDSFDGSGLPLFVDYGGGGLDG
jgi:hypothetical protein